MSDFLYSDKGSTPLMVSSKKMFAVTKTKPVENNEVPKDTFSVDGTEFVSWGPNNRLPDDAVMRIGSCGVLSTAVGFKARTSFGQGVLPYEYSGEYDEEGNPELVAFKDAKTLKYLNSYTFRKYATEAFRDLFKFGNAFPVMYLNEKGEIIALRIINARHCRISKDKTKLLIYTDFANTQPTSVKDGANGRIIDMLDESDPELDLRTRIAQDKLKGVTEIAFPRLRNYYSNTDYYGVPDWDAAEKSGWISVANKVPKFLQKAYDNAMSMMWHIQVPISWYDNKFPRDKYELTPDGEAQRREDIEAFWDKFEANLSGNENAMKTFITDYGLDSYGKGEDKWIIERLKNEIDVEERLSTSAAANSEILFSMMINPSTLGAGMPGGSYAGNSGSGSDIRESYLVSVITTYIEKQQILDPVKMMLMHNTKNEALELKYKETILTTLNTGNAVDTTTT